MASDHDLTAVQIRIPDPLARWLKARAAIDGESISSLVERLLRVECVGRPVGGIDPMASAEDAA